MKQRIIASLIAAIACYAPVAGIFAQERRPQVEITSRFRADLRPPPEPRRSTATSLSALGPYDIQRWTDRSDAPARLDVAPQRTVIVLADDLKLQNIRYQVNPPAVLVLVAEKLRIGPNATIDATESRSSGAGGKVILLANEIVCESGGKLQVTANGVGLSSNGGQVLVAGASQPRAGAAALPPCISATVNGAPERTGEVRDSRATSSSPPSGTITIRDHRRGRPTSVSTAPAPPPRPTVTTFRAGAPGRVFASPDIRALTQKEEMAQSAWSMWAVERLESLRFKIYDASRRNDRQGMLALFREYEAFNPSAQMLTPNMRDRYVAVVADLQTYRSNAVPPLWVEEVSVSPGGLPQPVTVFTEGATLKTSLAPTHALASRANIDGRSVLGVIDYSSERPDELAIEVEWELSVDPWMEQLVTQQIRKRGQTLDGVFSGWALEAKPTQEMAVKSATATLLPGGRRLRMRLIADAARANLVFWRLMNSVGLPWSVDWKFTEPGTGRVVNGTWAGPALTLARQRDPQIVFENGNLVNKTAHPVLVNYVRLKDGSFAALNPAIRVAAGERVPLGKPVSGIPREGVESLFNPDDFANDFYVINGAQVVDRVVVRNLLPTSDDKRGAFDRLELTVKMGLEGDNASGVATAGPFVLSAAGTRAAEISIPFLRLARGEGKITIEGRAYYAGDSYRTLKPTTFNSLSIAITADMFQ